MQQTPGKGAKILLAPLQQTEQKSKSKLNEGSKSTLQNTCPDLDWGGEQEIGVEQTHGTKPHVCFISNAKMESHLARSPIEAQEGKAKLKDTVDPHKRVLPPEMDVMTAWAHACNKLSWADVDRSLRVRVSCG